MTYDQLTATSLEGWSVRELSPHGLISAIFRLVNYINIIHNIYLGHSPLSEKALVMGTRKARSPANDWNSAGSIPDRRPFWSVMRMALSERGKYEKKCRIGRMAKTQHRISGFSQQIETSPTRLRGRMLRTVVFAGLVPIPRV